MPLLAQAAQMMRIQDRTLETVAHNMANVDTPGFRRMMQVDRPQGPSMNVATRTGVVTPTDSPLDVAIRGDAFIAVQAADGRVGLTRNGHLARSADGRLRSGAWTVLGDQGPLTLAPGPLEIGEDGTVRQEGEPVGRIRLMTAAADLAPIGDSVYQSAGASPATGARLQTSALEGSNVDTLRELTRMMDAVRAFEMSQKIALTDTEVRRKLTDEVGRTR